MNPDLRVLRVAVVPTETGNGIDQNSTVEQILTCEETKLFSVPDYFKAQNDEDIDLMHWSFLINIKTNEDCTGMNTDGIDMNTKASKISVIKTILSIWGMTTTSELELDSSPCISSVGTNKNNISNLVEEFTEDYARVITYHNEHIINEYEVAYEDLDEEIIDEIHAAMIYYDTYQKENK